MALNESEFATFIENLRSLSADFVQLGAMSDSQFKRFTRVLHESQLALKKNLFVDDYRNQADVEKFEFAFGAQSTQFIIDILPFLHQVMLENYQRSDELTLIDVGPRLLHRHEPARDARIATIIIYSKLKIDAVDYTKVRERWASALYPKIDYRVGDLFDLPDKQWDLVICSHVIEHLEAPRPFIDCAEAGVQGLCLHLLAIRGIRPDSLPLEHHFQRYVCGNRQVQARSTQEHGLARRSPGQPSACSPSSIAASQR